MQRRNEGYDLSISADCFVVMGFAAYAKATGSREDWEFAKKLGESVWERYQSGYYRSLPYPVSERYRPHAKPMILTNVCCELYKAAVMFDMGYASELLKKIEICHREVFEVFVDEKFLLHEFKYTDGDFPKNIFGQHINPGHTLEDMWFQMEAADLLGDHRNDKMMETITMETLQLGWDNDFGGIYHFIPCDGFPTKYDIGDAKDEPQLQLVLDDWESKLWWVHSEALYTTRLMYDRTGNKVFEEWFEKIFDYVYETFPNPNREIREWIQIRTREGKPQEKVVALPVKDPYHIIRNVVLIIELLEKERGK